MASSDVEDEDLRRAIAMSLLGGDAEAQSPNAEPIRSQQPPEQRPGIAGLTGSQTRAFRVASSIPGL